MSTTDPEIPNRFDFASAQPRIYQFWEDHRCFHSEPDPQRKPFTIVIPPPNVTGALHLGHALNNSLQDVLIRFRRMQGYNTLWMPGTDHAGIATQAVVERRLREEEGKTRHDLGREKLIERIWKWKEQYEARIIEQLKKMGCSCDWDRTRFTLDETCARAVRATFFDLFQKQLIYRGKRLVNWDTFLQTAVSDDEVFHDPVQGHFWHFRYPVIDPKPGEPEYVIIATTRPETMLGDTAVAVHPDPAKALSRLAKELQQRLASSPPKEKEGIAAQLDNATERQKTMLPQLEKLRDMALDGRKILLPLMEREIPLITDLWAKPELGSGCVKITPAHDANDYDVGLRQELPMINILNPDGTLNEEAGRYQGLSTIDARKRVVADLEAQGLLERIEDREIDLAHSDRSKTPIEPYLADQWFVEMTDLAQSAIDAVTENRVKIIPERYAKGYLDWLGEKRDWPIGRQLWWGHQIPVWSTTLSAKSVVGQTAAGSAISGVDLPHIESITVAKDGYDVRLKDGLEKILACRADEGPEEGQLTLFTCVAPGNESWEKKLEAAGLIREDDVLDTWFSSALWPHSTLGWPENTAELAYNYPTSTLITSRDIITLWVARMVLTGLNNVGDVPFREVYIHPKILDGYGETMSKSKGNGVDPLDVIDKFGADALRFGLVHLTTETQDLRMPVQFECPRCDARIEQTKQNRELPRITCEKCGKDFSTQWATAAGDLALPRGPIVSERFELARNFGNKLWNASRFALLNLKGYEAAELSQDDLAPEDRWILHRLSVVTRQTTEHLENYRYHDAAQVLYDFAWDEFCSAYLEMLKSRFRDEAARPVAQRALAHCLDLLMRLLHPIVPFMTEEIWQLLNQAAPQRGLPRPEAPSESIMLAPWPQEKPQLEDESIERQFDLFRNVLGAVNEIRSTHNISPKTEIMFCVRCSQDVADRITPLTSYFETMARAREKGIGPEVQAPQTCARVALPQGQGEVFVDLEGHIDLSAERNRLQKQVQKLSGMIAGKQKKLANENFVSKAPADVVRREQESLAQLKEELTTAETALESLGSGV